RVPRPVAQPWMRTIHPWAELLLAVCLLVTSGPTAVVAAALVALLFVGYLLLVLRALGSPEPTDCACFGAAGSEQISGVTVVRNVWLLLLSAAGLWFAFSGRSPLQWTLGAGPDAWWLAAMAAAAVTTALILMRGASTSTGVAHDAGGERGADEVEDYERIQTPNVPLTLPDGSVVSLRDFASSRPKLILAVSATCTSCVPTIDAATQWQQRLPELDVHLLFPSPASAVTSKPALPSVLYDPMKFAYEGLHMPGTPSAVLLGVDGMLAGGPVVGHDNISAFVADIDAELADSRVLSGSS
ncbi:MAG TPA: MauE/DoxX family redox-associated membrane protein, partial [Lapillicoccus sp.]|nr:MauE/DoxX family redox-associated membrane protein [Lapillicoccus sp.]